MAAGLVSLNLENGDLVLTSPFNRSLIDDLKDQIPYQDRAWDPAQKVWRVKYQHGSILVNLVKKYLGQTITVPSQTTYSDSYVHTRLFKVEYIGAARLRDDGSQTATGYVAGQWSIIFPQDVLAAWFGGDGKPNEPQTYFSILGVKKDAGPEEIKKAYRLAARTWHPDVNKEPNAAEQFRRIQEAWEVLRDDQSRRKYMAGLKFEQSLTRYEEKTREFSWCPPVRCGWVTVECTESVGKFFIKKILSWDEIKDDAGRSMVSYWPKGQDQFKSEFI